MISTFAEGEFWSKKSSTPSGMEEDDFDPSLNASCNLEASSCDLGGSCAKLASINFLDNPGGIPFIFTFSDFKLHK